MILNIKTAVRSQVAEIEDVLASCLAADSEKMKTYGNNFASECITESLFAATITCDKVVRGICVCESTPVPDGSEIIALYISDGFQCKGFGRKLLSHCLREMRSRRIKVVFLWLDERNLRAAKFFRKIGFVPDGKQRRMLGIDENYNEVRYHIDI